MVQYVRKTNSNLHQKRNKTKNNFYEKRKNVWTVSNWKIKSTGGYIKLNLGGRGFPLRGTTSPDFDLGEEIPWLRQMYLKKPIIVLYAKNQNCIVLSILYNIT